MATSAIFPDATVYEWNPDTKSYFPPPTIDPCKGYWVAVSTDQVVTVEGTPVFSWIDDTISAGWNMVGSIFGQSPGIASPKDNPPGSVQGFGYTWDPLTKSYVPTTTIEPGKGYWLAASQDCTLTLAPPPP